jgi:chaperonin GroES
MKVQPLRDNVLIKIEEQEEKDKTDSGIYLPDSASSSQDRPQIGKIIAVGEGEDIKVKEGDRVIYSKFAGNEVDVEDEKLLIVKNEDILAIIAK